MVGAVMVVGNVITRVLTTGRGGHGRGCSAISSNEAIAVIFSQPLIWINIHSVFTIRMTGSDYWCRFDVQPLTDWEVTGLSQNVNRT